LLTLVKLLFNFFDFDLLKKIEGALKRFFFFLWKKNFLKKKRRLRPTFKYFLDKKILKNLFFFKKSIDQCFLDLNCLKEFNKKFLDEDILFLAGDVKLEGLLKEPTRLSK